MRNAKINPSIIINQLPLACFWKDQDLYYQGCNQENLKAIKLKLKNFVGKTDFQMPWREVANRFFEQDKLVLDGRIQLSSDVITAIDGTKKTFLIKKAPIYAKNKKKIIGIVGTGMAISPENYKAEAAQFIVACGLKIQDLLPFYYPSDKTKIFVYGDIKFTKRQAQIISHLLKGYSAEVSARHLDLSRRSVESAVKLLKEKLGCKEKFQIIGKAIEHGFVELMFMNIV